MAGLAALQEIRHDGRPAVDTFLLLLLLLFLGNHRPRIGDILLRHGKALFELLLQPLSVLIKLLGICPAVVLQRPAIDRNAAQRRRLQLLLQQLRDTLLESGLLLQLLDLLLQPLLLLQRGKIQHKSILPPDAPIQAGKQ